MATGGDDLFPAFRISPQSEKILLPDRSVDRWLGWKSGQAQRTARNVQARQEQTLTLAEALEGSCKKHVESQEKP